MHVRPLNGLLRTFYKISCSAGAPQRLRQQRKHDERIVLSFYAKIGIRRLLARDNLLAGLPAYRAVARSAFVSLTVARQQGNPTPFRSLIPPELWKKIPGLLFKTGD